MIGILIVRGQARWGGWVKGFAPAPRGLEGDAVFAFALP
jgi:hypothetical protein